jgi:hypothetical protein
VTERTPYAAFADEGQPLYFRRRYGGDPQPPETQEIGGRRMMVVSLEPAEAIWIYGFSYDSEYAEDREQQRYAWGARRAFWAWCHSVMCPEGEPGSVPLDAVEEITPEAFAEAAGRGWR